MTRLCSPGRKVWGVHFNIPKPFTTFPAPIHVASEIANQGYCSDGRYRKVETHCIFHYTLRGRGVCRQGKQRWEVTTSHGFLNIINDPSAGYGYPATGTEPWEFVWFGFVGGNVREIVAELIRKNDAPVFHLPPNNALIRRLRCFRAHDGTSFTMTPTAGKRLVDDLFGALAETTRSDARDLVDDPIVEQILGLVTEQTDRNLSVKTMAAELQRSPEHLSRVFHACQGITLQQYIQQQRCLVACHLLKETSLSVKEIATRLRYGNAATFARAFRKTMRISPLVFRKNGIIPLFPPPSLKKMAKGR